MHDKIGLHVLTQCLREIEGDAYGPMRSLIRSRAEKSRWACDSGSGYLRSLSGCISLTHRIKDAEKLKIP